MRQSSILLFLLLVFCGQPTAKPSAARVETGPKFTLTSPAFADGERIPDQYTGVGKDSSPELNWSNPPTGTISFALVMDDPDAPRGTWTHWLIYNIPPEAKGLPFGVPWGESLPGGIRQLGNDGLRFVYIGPMPPPGKLHHYNFTLYALDRMLPAAGLVTRDDLCQAMAGHILDQAKLTGTYQR